MKTPIGTPVRLRQGSFIEILELDMPFPCGGIFHVKKKTDPSGLYNAETIIGRQLDFHY